MRIEFTDINGNVPEHLRQQIADAILLASLVHYSGAVELVGDNYIEFRVQQHPVGIPPPHKTSFVFLDGERRFWCTLNGSNPNIRSFVWEALAFFLLVATPGNHMSDLIYGKNHFTELHNAIKKSDTYKALNLAVTKGKSAPQVISFSNGQKKKFEKFSAEDIAALKDQLEFPNLFGRLYAFYMDPDGINDLLCNGQRGSNFFFNETEMNGLLDILHQLLIKLRWVGPFNDRPTSKTSGLQAKVPDSDT